ncbi:MAG: isochorismate synthase, partial [Chlorobaculum sp.]|nr:isochorismate synthase [Chlorobaculum sp.]
MRGTCRTMCLTRPENEPRNPVPADDSFFMMQKALQLLEESVKAAMRQRDGSPAVSGQPVLERFTAPLGEVDATRWLSAQRLFPRLFWMNREKSEWIAGIGEADRIEISETGPNDRSFL